MKPQIVPLMSASIGFLTFAMAVLAMVNPVHSGYPAANGLAPTTPAISQIA